MKKTKKTNKILNNQNSNKFRKENRYQKANKYQKVNKYLNLNRNQTISARLLFKKKSKKKR